MFKRRRKMWREPRGLVIQPLNTIRPDTSIYIIQYLWRKKKNILTKVLHNYKLLNTYKKITDKPLIVSNHSPQVGAYVSTMPSMK